MADRVNGRVGTARRGTLVGALLVAVLLAGSAQASLVGMWQLDGQTGGITPNGVVGGAAGVVEGGATFVNDTARGWVFQCDGANDDVAAGAVLALHQTNNDFTWSFWAKQNPGQPVNSDVILGNRWDDANGTTSWVKFTPNAFEYRQMGTDINYANIASDDVWHHHTVTKSGSTLTYYRDGTLAGSSTAAGNMQAVPFFIGGDNNGATSFEHWQGRIDDVALYDHALSPNEIYATMNGTFGRGHGGGQVVLNDAFNTLDTTLWTPTERGLERTGAGTLAASASGQLTISGTAGVNYWGGRTLESVKSYLSDYQTTFAIERVSLAATGTGARAGIMIWGDAGHFLLFAQNTEAAGGNWEFNWDDVGGLVGNPTGNGDNIPSLDAIDGDLGRHNMMLVFKPGLTANTATIDMYLDGQLAASQAFTNWTPASFQVMITGQGRQSGDVLTAVFDNALVAVLPEPATLTLLGLGGLLAARRRRRRKA